MNLATVNEYVQEIARLHAEVERLRAALAAYAAETKPTLDDADGYRTEDVKK